MKTTDDTAKLGKSLTDAKAECDQQHAASVKRIMASGLVYRDGNGNLVTIPED